MLMNIGTKYSALVSAIQKDWKDKTTNLTEIMLQIIRHFEFIKGNEKSNKIVLQISARSSRPSPITPKGSCKNQKYISKGFTTYYTNCCWIKHPKLRQKYTLNWMRLCGSQRNLKAQNGQESAKTELTPEKKS